MQKIVCEERRDEGLRFFRDGVCGTIRTIDSGGDKRVIEILDDEDIVLVKQATKKGTIECKIGGVADLSYPTSKLRRGRVQGMGNISPTITATQTGVHKIERDDNKVVRIRKLTPKECWRLQGFSDEHFNKAKNALNESFYKGKDRSDSQMYKMAGNSITTDVLYWIYVELYKAMPYLFENLKLGSFFSGIGAPEVALDRLYKDINSGNFQNPQAE